MLIIIWYSCIQGIHTLLCSKVSETHEHSKTFTEQMCNIYLNRQVPVHNGNLPKNDIDYSI